VVGLARPAGEPARAAAGINQTVNYQGRLLNNQGAVVADGTYNMRFKIYQDGDGQSAADATGSPAGSLKWTETHTNNGGTAITVKNGYFSVNLGALTAFGSSVDWNQDTLWLSLDVTTNGTDTAVPGSLTWNGEMLPMKRLASAVYALNAGELGGIAASGFIQNILPSASPQNANINVLNAGATSVATAELQQVASATAPVLIVKGGATPGSGSDLIQLQSSSSTVASFDSSGNLKVAASIDTQSAGTLNIAPASSANATAISLNQSTTVAAGKTLTVTSGATSLTGATSGDALTVSNNTSTGNILVLKDNATAVATVADGGATTFENTSNSTSAFQIQNASASTLLNVDTSTTVNLLPENASNFETGMGWSTLGSGVTVTQNSGDVTALYGSNTMKIVTTAAGPTGVQYAQSFTSGTQYIISAFAMLASGSMGSYRMGYHDTTDHDCGSQTLVTTGWTREFCSFTASATASGYLYIRDNATTHTFYVDGVQFESGTTTASAYNPGGTLQLNGAITSQMSIQPAVNSTAAMQYLSAGGAVSLLQVDSLDQRIGIDIANGTPSYDLAFGNNTNRTIGINGNASGAGHNLTVQVGPVTSGGTNAGGNLNLNAGNTNGSGAAGNVNITPGANTGGGTQGNVIVVPGSGSDSATFFQIQNAAGTRELTVDTVGNQLILGTVSSLTGGLALANAGSAFTISLQGAAQTGGSSTLTLPNTAGVNDTVCLKTLANCNGLGSNVSSLDLLSGALTINNSTGTGSAITINDSAADGTTKGIATFNATNFSASGGVVNTIQNIATNSSPTFTAVNTNTITPSAAMTLGATTQAFTLQGSAASVLTATGGGFTTTVGFTGTPVGAVTYNYDRAAAAGTYTICTTASNCSAAGSGYILDQSSTPGSAQTGNFNITGTGVAGTAFQAPAFDTASAGALTIGNANATSIGIGNTTSNVAATINGTTLVKPTSGNDSATAFQVQNAAGTSLLNVNSTAANMSVSTVGGSLNVLGVANPAAPTLTSSGSGGSLTAQTYYYRLSAQGPTGEYTTAIASSPASVTTSGSASKNTLTWTAVSNSQGYKIYRSTDNSTWFSNTVSSATTSIVDNGVTYSWGTSDTPHLGSNNTGGIIMQTGTGLYLDGGAGSGNAVLNYLPAYNSLAIDDANAGGNINLQADNLIFEDTVNNNNDLTINNNGNATFQNATNSTTAFRVQNASSAPLFTVDTTNTAIVLGKDTSPTALTVRGGVASGSNVGGANLTFDASNGTGNQNSGDLIFRTAAGNGAGITNDSSGNNNNACSASTTSCTWSYSVPATNSTTHILLVAVSAGKGSTGGTSTTGMPTVTYAGTSMTRITGGSSNCDIVTGGSYKQICLFYLLNPTTGANNVVATVSPNGTSWQLGAATFYNVDQTTPLGNSNFSIGTTSPASSTINTSSNQLVVDAVGVNAQTPTNNASQTNLYTDTNFPITGASYKAAGASSTTMQWTFTNTEWGDIAVALNPTTNSTTDTLTDRLHITGSGNVGIGTATPAANLTVQTSANNTQTFQIQNAAAAQVLNLDTTNNILTVGSGVASTLAPWTTSSTSLPGAIKYMATVTANGYVYSIGGNNGAADQTTVNYARLNADGTVGNFSSTTALPQTERALSAIAIKGYIYVLGGIHAGTVQSTVYYAHINSDGTLGSWTTSANTLPVALQLVMPAAANGYLYAIGGTNGSAADVNTVYYAKLNSDGSIGTWTTNANNLSQATAGGAPVVANGYMYLFGGNTSFQKYQYAQLNSDGSTGSWTLSGTVLSSHRQFVSAAISNGTVYVIGGWNSSNCLSSIESASLGSGGALGSFSTQTNSMPGGVCTGEYAVTANGYIYTIGGEDTSGTAQSAIYYTSGPRLKVAASLDLVGLDSGSLASTGSQGNGSVGGTLAAGNTNIVGTLQVQDAATFSRGVAVNGTLTANSDATFADATNSTTAFQVQNSSGTSLMSFDTVNDQLKVNDTQVGSAADVGSVGHEFADSFEAGSVAAWSGGGGGTGTPAIDSATVRDGRYSYKLATTNTHGAYVQTTIPSNSTQYARVYFDTTVQANKTPLIDFGTAAIGSGVHLYIDTESSNNLCFNYNSGASSGCSATAPSASTWHKLEVEVIPNGAGASTLKVWLDGTLVTTGSNALNTTTASLGSTNFTNVAIGNSDTVANATTTTYFDSMVVDTVPTGDSASLYVADAVHAGGSVSIATNSVAAFQVQNAAGTATLAADTNDSRVGIGTSGTPAALLSIGGSTGNLQVDGSGDITAAGTATWSTSSGNLNLQVAGTNTLALDSGGAGTITVGGANATTITVGGNAAATITNKVANSSTTAYTLQTAGGTALLVADTTNGLLYVGGASAASTPVLLVLGNKTAAGDPTGVAGAMYYNAGMSKFRCYENSVWRDCMHTARTGFYYYSDFMSGPQTVANENQNISDNTISFDNGLATSGSNTLGVAAQSGHPGIVAQHTGTNTAGWAAYITGQAGDVSSTSQMLLGNNNTWSYETDVEFPTLSNGTDTYTYRAGFIQSSNSDGTNACFFRYTDNGGASPNGLWQGVCRAANTESTCTGASPVTVAINTWYRLDVIVNSGGTSTDFQVNGTDLCQVTNNIPTSAGQGLGFGGEIVKSAGTTDTTANVDYVEVVGDLSTAR
jgi:hypothetical protein